MTPFSLSRWLRPKARFCPVCRKTSMPGSRTPSIPVRHPEARCVLQQLCYACMDSIPWIVSPVCRICGRPETCPDCPRRDNRQFSFCRSAVRYDKKMSQLLALYKYRGSEGLGPVMAALLASAYERIRDEMPQRTKAPLFHAVTSVPLAPERLEERGFNQAERMAQTLAGWYGLPCLPLLQRVRHTEKQSLKTRRNRLADMKGNFSAADARMPATLFPTGKGPIRILLIDDIYTTGSTVNECAGALKRMISSGTEPLDIEIYGALWARS